MDKEWISIMQITLFMDELVGYIKENLKIYNRADGKIDYLSLANDTTIFNLKNKRRIRQSFTAARGSVTDRLSVDDGLGPQSSFRQSIVSNFS